MEVLAFNPSLDKPVWAEVLSNRFVDGPEKALLKDLKDAFESEFGRATSEQSPLAILGLTAQCLWTLVGSLSQVAQMPAERQVVKPDIAFSCIFSGPGPLWAPISFGLFFLYFNLFYRLCEPCSVFWRLAATLSKNGKPAVVLLNDYTLWLVNPSESQMEVNAGELCGFGTGSFDEAIVRASDSLEPNLFASFFLCFFGCC